MKEKQTPVGIHKELAFLTPTFRIHHKASTIPLRNSVNSFKFD
jgi:hypothetical protein